MLHEHVDLNCVVVLVRAVDGEADGADESAVLAVGVDADEGGVLAVAVAVVRLDELLEALGELLHFHFDRHPTIYNFIYTSNKEDPTTQTNIGLALPIEFKPGDKWQYSNTNYWLLAKVIEKVSGLTYAELAEREAL